MDASEQQKDFSQCMLWVEVKYFKKKIKGYSIMETLHYLQTCVFIQEYDNFMHVS